MPPSTYWILEWLRENRISSVEEAAALLPRYRVLKALQGCAEQVSLQQRERIPRDQLAIVAGTGVDLSGGRMVCPSPSCLRLQVDTLLKHIWHYFDFVVVDDVLTPLLTEEWHGSKAELIHEILTQLVPVLYLQEIGAADLVEFRSKNHCSEHWEQHARDEGLGAVLDSRGQLISDLSRVSSFSWARNNKQLMYVIGCPDAGVNVAVPASRCDEIEAQEFLLGEVFAEYMVDLTADVLAAHEHNLPLGCARPFAGKILQLSRPANTADVIFQLDLPVLEGVRPIDLISIRREQHEYFDRFRNSLRQAAKERLNTASGSSASEIADEIRMDVIEPELAKLKVQLATSERTLQKKTAVGMFVGALATTCGLLCGAGATVAVSAGVAAALGAVGSSAMRRLDEKREVELNDMYFLWKAVEHGH